MLTAKLQFPDPLDNVLLEQRMIHYSFVSFVIRERPIYRTANIVLALSFVFVASACQDSADAMKVRMHTCFVEYIDINCTPRSRVNLLDLTAYKPPANKALAINYELFVSVVRHEAVWASQGALCEQ